MITIEEKLDVFTKLVLEKVQNEYEEKYRKITGKNEEIISDYKAKLKEKSKKIIEDYTDKGQLERNRLISKAKVEKKRKILEKKEELIKRLLDNIIKMAEQFTYQDNYSRFLMENISEILSDFNDKKSIVLYFTDKDREKFQEYILDKLIKHGFIKDNIDILSLGSEFIGGVIATDREETIRIDCTLKTILEDNKDLIGRKLYEALDENR